MALKRRVFFVMIAIGERGFGKKEKKHDTKRRIDGMASMTVVSMTDQQSSCGHFPFAWHWPVSSLGRTQNSRTRTFTSSKFILYLVGSLFALACRADIPNAFDVLVFDTQACGNSLNSHEQHSLTFPGSSLHQRKVLPFPSTHILRHRRPSSEQKVATAALG